MKKIISQIQNITPWFVVVTIITVLALCLSLSFGIPVMLIALLLGMSLWFIHRKTLCKAGIEWTASKVLRFWVALIGFRIAFSDILSLGWQTGIVLVGAVVSTIYLWVVLSRVFWISKQFGILSWGATGICGASAALAISSVLPESKEKETNTLLVIIGATVLSTVAMVSYPMFAMAIGLGYTESSIFLGGSIHDVAQVVGAGYSISPEVGDKAVLTKLIRVSLLVPIVLALVFFAGKNTSNWSEKKATIFPFFLIAFISIMIVNSIINIPPFISDTAETVSKYALIAAITAIGMKTHLRQILNVGYKPMLIMVLEALWIAGVFLVYFVVV